MENSERITRGRLWPGAGAPVDEIDATLLTFKILLSPTGLEQAIPRAGLHLSAISGYWRTAGPEQSHP